MDARIEGGGCSAEVVDCAMKHLSATIRLQRSIEGLMDTQEHDRQEIERAERLLAETRVRVAERERLIADYRAAIEALKA